MDNIDTTAPPPPAPPARTNPPHRHSRRQFLSEIAIVVIGVLLALGAEQIVQWWNWQSEVEESREAINAEISYNLASRKLRNDQTDCIERRIDDLQRWHDSWISGRPLTPSAPIGQPASRVLLFDAWDIAQNGQVAAHIPLRDRIRYAQIYGFFRVFERTTREDGEKWEKLQDYDGATSLSMRDLMQLQGIITILRESNEARKRNWPIFAEVPRSFGIAVGQYQAAGPDRLLCKPLIAGPAVNVARSR